MGLDSVEMIMAIEEEFGLDIPNSDAERMVTVSVVMVPFSILSRHFNYSINLRYN